MKYNKRICFLSIFSTVISLVLYFSFRTCCDIVKDLSLSLFSASCLLIFTAYIGYFVEKSSAKRKILSAINENFYITLSAESDNNMANTSAIKRAIKKTLTDLHILHELLVDYYTGCFKKDTQLQSIINDTIRNYAEKLTQLEVYLSSEEPKNYIIDNKIKALADMSDGVIDTLIAWIEKSNFETGEDFKFSENFISEYEEDT